jgi:hypothetical protein
LATYAYGYDLANSGQVGNMPMGPQAYSQDNMVAERGASFHRSPQRAQFRFRLGSVDVFRPLRRPRQGASAQPGDFCGLNAMPQA